MFASQVMGSVPANPFSFEDRAGGGAFGVRTALLNATRHAPRRAVLLFAAGKRSNVTSFERERLRNAPLCAT